MTYKDEEKRREYSRKWFAARPNYFKDRAKRLKEDPESRRPYAGKPLATPEELRTRRNERNKRLSHEKREYIRQAKRQPCTDCDTEYPYYVMQFDHVRGEKLFNLSSYTGGYKRIDEEIAKCDVVCANCHFIRTHERGYAENPLYP